eukprot:scaffold106618_cov77-Phaeocystis_antarctica.AAC.4
MGVWFFSRSLATVLESERRSSFVLRSEVVSSEHELPHADDRHARAVVLELGEPLLLRVLVRGAADEREGDEEDVGLRVAEGAQPVIVLLPCRVPQAQVDRLAVHHHVGRVVVEDGRDVVLRAVVRSGAEVGSGGGAGASDPDPNHPKPNPNQDVKRERCTSGKALVVYEMRRQVLPTAPSPTITHFTFCIIDMVARGEGHQKACQGANHAGELRSTLRLGAWLHRFSPAQLAEQHS